MRTITLLIIHCSAVKPDQTSSTSQIDEWHKKRGWKCIGYHYVIRRDGSIERGRLESMVGAHCQNHNQHSIGICYEGGLDANGKPADTRTPEQRASMRALLVKLKQSYPRALIMGHNVFNPQKACPCFDAAKEYQDLQPK